MKYLYSIFFICLSYFSYGQMTLVDLMKIYKMDMDHFETYALSKGYNLSRFDRNDNVDGVVYVKGTGKETRHLTLYESWFTDGPSVDFQTRNSNELLNIKNQLNSLGFKIFDSYFMSDGSGTQVKKYRNNKYELQIFTIPPDDNDIYIVYELLFKQF